MNISNFGYEYFK